MSWVPKSSLRGALLAGLAAGAVKTAIALPFIGRYGWHRDELYFLAAAKHPSLGYVDFPPVTAWVAWLVHALAGNSLVALRLTSLAASVGAIVFVSLMARELGGTRRAQFAAALAFALTPYVLAASAIYHTTWLDLLAWSALLYVLLRVLGRPEPRLWPLAGVLAGIALETKYTVAALLIALALGLLLTPSRRLLATRGPWLAAAIAALVLLPNLVWQAVHGWPSWKFFPSQRSATVADATRVDFLTEHLIFFGASLIVATVGVLWLWRRPNLRPLALVPVIVAALFVAEGGRAYYPMPAYTLPVAAGAVAIEAWLRRNRSLRIGALAALALCQLALVIYAIPAVVPIRSTAEFARSPSSAVNIFSEEIGWHELVAQTAAVWRSLTPAERADAVILTGDYGEAGAISLFGPAEGLPQPLSGHLSWQYWHPKRMPQRHAVVVGLAPEGLDWACEAWILVQQISNRWNVPNEESHDFIATCRLRRPLGELWNHGIAGDNL
ncbi:MAG: glycosyltransferase family 39 protein [Gaiellaceae bacterium]|jgi:4-amino-4-deoxy-L-arabinose transferase-like glycosyltransferase